MLGGAAGSVVIVMVESERGSPTRQETGARVRDALTRMILGWALDSILSITGKTTLQKQEKAQNKQRRHRAGPEWRYRKKKEEGKGDPGDQSHFPTSGGEERRWVQTKHPPCSLCTPKAWSKSPENWSLAYCLSVLEGTGGTAGRLFL